MISRNLHPGKIIFVHFLLISVFLACNNEPQSSGNKTSGNNSAQADPVAKKEPDVPELSTEQYVTNLVNRREAIKKQLPGISHATAVQLYQSLVLYMDTVITGITKNEGNWLVEYVNYYDEKKKVIVLPVTIQSRVDLLATAGLEPWPIGEGMTDLRTVPRFYTDIFQSSLPADYRQFLGIRADEDTILYSADAGIIIPLEMVGERVLNWERFLANFPNSVFWGEARDHFQRYLRDYLLGEDNTPSFSAIDDTKSLLPDNRKEYLLFLERYGNTTAAGTVRWFIEKLENEKSLPEFKRKLIREIDLLYTTEITSAAGETVLLPETIEKLTKPVYDTVPLKIEMGNDVTEGVNRALDTVLYLLQDNNLYSFAVFTNRGESGGAPFSGWCDVWAFKYSNGNWQIIDYRLHAGGGGMYGNSGYFDKLVRMGDNAAGIVITGGITHMGSNKSWDDVIPFSGEKLLMPVDIVTNDAYENHEGLVRANETKWFFRKKGPAGWYDLVIIPSSRIYHVLPLERVVVTGVNGKYQVPEKFLDKGI